MWPPASCTASQSSVRPGTNLSSAMERKPLGELAASTEQTSVVLRPQPPLARATWKSMSFCVTDLPSSLAADSCVPIADMTIRLGSSSPLIVMGENNLSNMGPSLWT